MNNTQKSRFRGRIALAAVILVLALASLLQAAALPKAKPAEVGLSAERLARLGRVMQMYVDEDKTKGIVVLLMRNGKVAYHEAFGKLDPEKGTPMPLDAIFRVASQSKAVTSAAVMTLFEEGRFLLDDPISRYIPEFADARVAVPSMEKGAKGYATVPLKRPITIRDLPNSHSRDLLRRRTCPGGICKGRHLRLVPGGQGRPGRRRHPEARLPPVRRSAGREMGLRL